MPDIEGNELRVFYLKRMGYGFKAIAKDIGVSPAAVRLWLIKAGFELGAGTKSPAYKARWEALKASPHVIARRNTEEHNATYSGTWQNEWVDVVEDYYSEIHRLTLHRKNPYPAGTPEYRRHWIFMKTGRKPKPISEYLASVKPSNTTRDSKVRRLRKRLKDFIKSGTKTHVHLFGCSSHLLRIHIESQFKQGMSWSNYGDWHIDHIRPCASFLFEERSDALLCFNWRNLRPMWAKDNHRKGSKWKGQLWAMGAPIEQFKDPCAA
jgi:predicted transcriptional regulator